MKKPKIKDYTHEGCIMWENYSKALEAYIDADEERPKTVVECTNHVSPHNRVYEWIEVQFPSIRKEGKDYTLDGKQQIPSNTYSKNISRALISAIQTCGGFYGWEHVVTCTAEEWVIVNTVKL
jgi:hypothetical protein